MKIPLSEIQRMISQKQDEIDLLNKHFEGPEDIHDAYNSLIWHLKQIEKDLT